MASEREANAAREQHSDFLRRLGAHAIAVDEVRRGGEKTFAVVAFVEGEPAGPVPRQLEVKVGSRTVQVPLAVKRAERFKPE